MSLLRLHTRLTRLEARRPPVVIDAAPWEVPPGYLEEVYRIIWATGCYASIEDLAQKIEGHTDPAVVAWLTCVLQEPPPNAF